MWEWFAAIKGETWGAFAGGLVVFVIKVVGPVLAKYATEAFRRKAKELEALADNDREEIVETENRRLRIELGLARRDLNAAGETERVMADQINTLERERDVWRLRAEALAREHGLKPGGKDVGANRQRAGVAGTTYRYPPGRADPARSMDHVPTVPPRKPDP